MLARQAEHALLDAAWRGDREARAVLVERLGPSIWSTCRRLDPDPEDAYQAAWERLWANLGRYRPEGGASVKTWALVIVRRMLVDRHRRRQTRGTVVELEELPPVDTGLVEALQQRQRRVRLERALARLPEAQRRVVVGHHLHGAPLQQLAEEEGVSLGTIKSRLHRGRARLAGWMEEA